MNPGYVYGNATVSDAVAQSHFNNSFSTDAVNDAPDESRMESSVRGVEVVKR